MECIVCRGIIRNGEKTANCPECGSRGHYPHLAEWVKMKGTCPACREEIKGDNLVIMSGKEEFLEIMKTGSVNDKRLAVLKWRKFNDVRIVGEIARIYLEAEDPLKRTAYLVLNSLDGTGINEIVPAIKEEEDMDEVSMVYLLERLKIRFNFLLNSGTVTKIVIFHELKDILAILKEKKESKNQKMREAIREILSLFF